MVLVPTHTSFALRTAHFFIFLFHFFLSLITRKATVCGKKIKYVIVIRLFYLNAKKWCLFALKFTCSIKLQRRSRNLSHIFHIPCLSMINLCLSFDKKIAVKKNISRTRARISKNQKTRTIYIFYLALWVFSHQLSLSLLVLVLKTANFFNHLSK